MTFSWKISWCKARPYLAVAATTAAELDDALGLALVHALAVVFVDGVGQADVGHAVGDRLRGTRD